MSFQGLERRRYSTRTRLRVIVLAGVLLATLALLGALITGRLSVVGEFTRWLVAPVEARWSARGDALRTRLEEPNSIEALRAQNEQLQAEVNKLTVAQVRLAEIEQENRRLRALLKFAQTRPYYDVQGASVVGQVIGRDPSVLIQRFIIDVGELQGIRPGMPVVTDTGLVGQILRVHKNTAEVLPITARESAVNAIVQSSRLTGVIRGQNSDTLRLEYIPLDRPVEVGDLILTSGLGTIYPPKLVIGQVVSVQRHDYDMFQTALIRPTVDFHRLEQVLIITDFHPNPEITSFLKEVEEELGNSR